MKSSAFAILCLVFLIIGCGNSREAELAEKEKALLEKELELTKKELESQKASASQVDQSDPTAVMRVLFSAANSGDFSSLSVLCDPLGESDVDVRFLCEIASASKEDQDNFRNAYEGGMVLAQPKITGETATLKFGIGLDAEHEAEMSFVRRDGKWYLFGI